MFAVIAFFCFLLALFNVHVGSVNLVTLGLMFIALQMAVGGAINWSGWFPRRP